jgi:hypothetical protein
MGPHVSLSDRLALQLFGITRARVESSMGEINTRVIDADMCLRIGRGLAVHGLRHVAQALLRLTPLAEGAEGAAGAAGAAADAAADARRARSRAATLLALADRAEASGGRMTSPSVAAAEARMASSGGADGEEADSDSEEEEEEEEEDKEDKRKEGAPPLDSAWRELLLSGGEGEALDAATGATVAIRPPLRAPEARTVHRRLPNAAYYRKLARWGSDIHALARGTQWLTQEMALRGLVDVPEEVPKGETAGEEAPDVLPDTEGRRRQVRGRAK